MRKLKNIAAMILAAVLITGCSAPGTNNITEEENLPIGFTSTRADGLAEGAALRLLAYDTGALEPVSNLSEVKIGRKLGYGTYRFNTPDERHGTMIPCAVDGNGNPVSPTDLTSNEGLILPLSGTTGNRTYNIYMFTPAMEVVNNGQGSYRIKYFRDNPMKISAQPFPITVSLSHYNIFDIPAESRVFDDMISKFHFDFIQGRDEAFEVSDVKVLNVGEYALYHPVLKINQIVNQADPDTGVRTESPVTLADKGNSEKGKTSFITAEEDAVAVFPTNYTLESVSELVFQFVLKMGANQANLEVPIAIEVKPRTHYRFHITVTSALIDITYDMLDWEHNILPPDGSGSNGFSIPLGTFPVGDWNNGYDDTETIG